MKRMILGLLLAALGAPPDDVLVAQESRLVSGTEVRLLVLSSREIRGDLVEWGADTFRVRDPESGFVHAVPALEIERVRVPEPRTRGQGALRGLLIGSIVGALSFGTLLAASEAGCESWCFNSVGEAFLVGAAVGGAGGGGLGAGLGTLSPGTRWVDVTPRR